MSDSLSEEDLANKSAESLFHLIKAARSEPLVKSLRKINASLRLPVLNSLRFVSISG